MSSVGTVLRSRTPGPPPGRLRAKHAALSPALTGALAEHEAQPGAQSCREPWWASWWCKCFDAWCFCSAAPGPHSGLSPRTRFDTRSDEAMSGESRSCTSSVPLLGILREDVRSETRPVFFLLRVPRSKARRREAEKGGGRSSCAPRSAPSACAAFCVARALHSPLLPESCSWRPRRGGGSPDMFQVTTYRFSWFQRVLTADSSSHPAGSSCPKQTKSYRKR